MNKILPLILLLSCFYNAHAQTTPKYLIRGGVLGQFYINKAMNREENAPMGFLKMHGSDGTWASVGIGFGFSFLYNTTRNISFWITPNIRYSLLETQTPTGLYGPDKWRFTLDLHGGVQWNLHANNWLFKKSALGVGLSLLNIGQSFDTYYTWVKTGGQTTEYQATTLMTFGINLFYEKKLSSKFSTKFMVIYTGGNFINWTPLYAYTINGNISVQYLFFSK